MVEPVHPPAGAVAESERRRAWSEGAERITAALATVLGPGDELLDVVVAEARTLTGARSATFVRVVEGRTGVASHTGGAASAADTVERLAAQVQAAADRDDVVVAEASGRPTYVAPVRATADAAGLLVIDGAEPWPGTDTLQRELVGALADHAGRALDRGRWVRERHDLLLARDRARVARDLHDLVVQRLYATGLQLRLARDREDLEVLRGAAEQAVAGLDAAITDLRAVVHDLRRSAGRSLHEEARALLDEYAPVLGFRPVLRIAGDVDSAASAESADALLLSLRELLSNVARHARAGTVLVELAASPRWVSLHVSDDGVGFDPGSARRGDGLVNLEHRAERLGGHVALESAPGRGSRVEWMVPAVAVP